MQLKNRPAKLIVILSEVEGPACLDTLYNAKENDYPQHGHEGLAF